MSIYNDVMILQTGCLILQVCVTAAIYAMKKKSWRDPVLMLLLSVLLITAGYFLFLQTTGYEGLRVAQKVYLTGKTAAPAMLVAAYLSVFAVWPETKRSAVKILLAVLTLTQLLFIWSDTLQSLVFTESTMEQNQFFYYLQENLTGLGKTGLITALLLLLAGALLAALKAQGLPQKLLFAAIPVIAAAAELLSLQSAARHYDFTSLAVTADACLLLIGMSMEKAEEQSHMRCEEAQSEEEKYDR